MLAAAFLILPLAAQRGAQPPETPIVGEDGHVTLRVRAPRARSVALNAAWAGGRMPLSRNEDGIWSITVGPVPPGIYSYTFQLDGVRILDPHNTAVKTWSGGNASLVEVRSGEPQPYDLREVPHGSLRLHSYASASGGTSRGVVVYTPPGYEQSADRKYPISLPGAWFRG